MAASKSPTVRRILREAAELSKSPSPDYTAHPLESDLHEWHFTLRGPPKSPYSQGIYHGRIVLPPLYPLRPPSFRFLTPSGRFEVNREICLSISGHHEESWQPAWGVRTALVALRSFMETDAKGQVGGLDTPKSLREEHAVDSHSFRCATCGKTNIEIMEACEEVCKQSADQSQPIEIPPDLRLGRKDEKSPGKDSPAPAPVPAPPVQGSCAMSSSSGSQSDPELAELAEGFVETTATPPPVRRSSSPPISQPNTPPRSGHAPPPGRNGPPTSEGYTTACPQRPDEEDDAFAMWMDAVIGLLLMAFIAMIIKFVLSS